MPVVGGLFERLGLGFERRWGLAVLAVGAATSLFFLAILVQDKEPTWYFTRDPAAATNEAWYLGAASSIGVAGWMVTTTLFAVIALVRHRAGGEYLPIVGAMLATGLLWFDDLFLLHEQIVNDVVPEEVTIAVYALFVPAYFVVIRRHLPPVTRTLLLLGLGGLALSVITDRFESDHDLQNILEDGFKFLGIWLWVLAALAMLLVTLDDFAATDRT